MMDSEQCIGQKSLSLSESKNDNNALHNISFSIKAGGWWCRTSGEEVHVVKPTLGFDPQEGSSC